MNEIIVSNTQGKNKILNTLLALKYKGTYECAEQLTEHSKSDLETSKVDIESYIDKRRTTAAGLAVLGVILPIVVNTSIIEFIADSLGSNSAKVVVLIENLVAFFLLISSIQVFIDVDKTISCLHIIKIAIAQKSDEQRLKELFKTAIVEELEKRSDLLGDIVEQVFEDVALVHAIEEGEKTEAINRNQVFKLFEGEA